MQLFCCLCLDSHLKDFILLIAITSTLVDKKMMYITCDKQGIKIQYNLFIKEVPLLKKSNIVSLLKKTNVVPLLEKTNTIYLLKETNIVLLVKKTNPIPLLKRAEYNLFNKDDQYNPYTKEHPI